MSDLQIVPGKGVTPYDMYHRFLRNVTTKEGEHWTLDRFIKYRELYSLPNLMTEDQFEELLGDVLFICSAKLDILNCTVQFNVYYDDTKDQLMKPTKTLFTEWLGLYKFIIGQMGLQNDKGAMQYDSIVHQENLLRYAARIYALERGWHHRADNEKYPE